MTFRSQLYTGSISDREIFRSGFLNLPFDGEDSIMADKEIKNKKKGKISTHNKLKLQRKNLFM